MEVLGQWRWSLRGSRQANNTIDNRRSFGAGTLSRTDNSSSTHSVSKKRSGSSSCDICGKRLIKLAKWRNYFTMPCKCHHAFCKQCITERLECRQKVLRSASFGTMWTFPCPGSTQCGQELTVDWSRGRSFSRNLVARDMGGSDDSLDYDEESDESVLQEMG